MSVMQLLERAASNNPTVAAALADANQANQEATRAEAALEHEEQMAIEDAKETVASLKEQKDLSTKLHKKKAQQDCG
jgi:pyrimidine deaminase RibD-like protein